LPPDTHSRTRLANSRVLGGFTGSDVPRRLAWVMMLPGGTLRVSQTLPPITESQPTVTRPSTVAPE
jgi:hypothetical protein